MTALWSVLQAADLALTSLDEKVLVMKLKFAVAPFISAAILGLFASHGGRAALLTRRNLALLSALPLTSAALALTAEVHSLFILDPYLPVSSTTSLAWTPGPLFPVYIVSTYGPIIAGVLLTLYSVRDAHPAYQKQAIVLILALLPPAVFELLATLELLPPELEDLAVAAFAMSVMIMAVGLGKHRALDVRPIARGEVVESIPDAMLVVDSDGRLIDLNRSAEPLLAVPAERALGMPMAKALRCAPEVAQLLRSPEARREIISGCGAERRKYDAMVRPIMVKDELRARMVLMRDITDRQRAEEALHAVNGRLDILSSLTRHDLLNRLAVIDGYVALGLKERDPERLRTFMEKMERSVEAARKLIEFTGDYERVGIKEPAWLCVDELFARASSQFPLDGIEVTVRADGLSLYADAMLEKVFYNLVDNTLRHGGRVSRISLEYADLGDRLSLVYRDDGVGVPGKEKPLIFLRDFGANSGLGLFLAREVLAITGIEIVENGEQGQGARFEMTVPFGSYRLVAGSDALRESRPERAARKLTSSRPPSCPTTH